MVYWDNQYFGRPLRMYYVSVHYENFQEKPSETFLLVELPFVIVKKQNTVNIVS